jgi:hypothetical protein
VQGIVDDLNERIESVDLISAHKMAIWASLRSDFSTDEAYSAGVMAG